MAREGVLVVPYQRLNEDQIKRIHKASMDILLNQGISCYNKDGAEYFASAGADVSVVESGTDTHWQLKIPEKIIMDAVESAPQTVKLGARDEDNSLILNGKETRVRFASGSETNNWLDVNTEVFVSKTGM